jgi:hypothetical protein
VAVIIFVIINTLVAYHCLVALEREGSLDFPLLIL